MGGGGERGREASLACARPTRTRAIEALGLAEEGETQTARRRVEIRERREVVKGQGLGSGSEVAQGKSA